LVFFENLKLFSSAAIPAAWTAVKTPESMFDLTFKSAWMTSGLPTAKPTLQPVMLQVFDSEWNSIAISRAPGISKMLSGFSFPK